MLDVMIEAAMRVFKQKIVDFGENHDLSELTPELADVMGRALLDALAQAGQAGYAAFLESYDVKEEVVCDAHGEEFRLKDQRPKKCLSPFGVVEVMRWCYQNKSDTKSYVPLDAAWGMEGRYLTPPVREAMLYLCALVTPVEATQILRKCALFHPHATLAKREVVKTGALLEAHQEDLARAVRATEQVPEGTRAFVVSIDGTTMLMNDKGVHFGRKR